MSEPARPRDYRLSGDGPTVDIPHESWYQCSIPRKRLKELMRRSDGPTLRNYALWIALLVGSGILAWWSWGTWYAIPAFMAYGVFYASCGESRWHECSHGTPFRTRWLNEAFYHFASFLSLKNPYLWRWSHARHHTDTIVVGRDPEIAYPRPPDLRGMLFNLLHMKTGLKESWKTLRVAFGWFSPDELDYVPEMERPKVVWVARAHCAILVAVTIWAVAIGSWMPVLFVGLPTFYGSWLHHLMSSTQHAGLAEDVPDHRLNSRTVRLNPVLCFIYSNMNYHVEHHMFPMVPFHALPALHREIRHDLPPAYNGLLGAYREMIPALLRQMRDPTYFVKRTLPPTATPSPALT